MFRAGCLQVSRGPSKGAARSRFFVFAFYKVELRRAKTIENRKSKIELKCYTTKLVCYSRLFLPAPRLVTSPPRPPRAALPTPLSSSVSKLATYDTGTQDFVTAVAQQEWRETTPTGNEEQHNERERTKQTTPTARQDRQSGMKQAIWLWCALLLDRLDCYIFTPAWRRGSATPSTPRRSCS